MTLTFYSWRRRRRWWKSSSFTPGEPNSKPQESATSKSERSSSKSSSSSSSSSSTRYPTVTETSEVIYPPQTNPALVAQQAAMVASKIKAAGSYAEGSGSDSSSETTVKNTGTASPKSAGRQRQHNPHTYLGKMDIPGAQNFCEMHL